MKKKNDIKLIFGIIIVAVLFLLFRFMTAEEGAVAVVYVDGKKIAEYSLSEERTVSVEGYDGGYNILVIEDGKAYLSDADCPDGLCVGMGEIEYDGETIVCLPHKVVIEIESEKENDISGDGIDAVTK